jgi:undecaprenyl diphosphate synthase
LKTIGDTGALPSEVSAELADATVKTQNNTGLTLVLALSYSGRWDLKGAVRRLVRDAIAGTVREEDVTEERITGCLSTAGFPDPDLLIRTSGELRVSNFLLWQIAYTEMYISALNWPAFRRPELYAAIRDYQLRERRFGMVSEQVRGDPAKGRTMAASATGT